MTVESPRIQVANGEIATWTVEGTLYGTWPWPDLEEDSWKPPIIAHLEPKKLENYKITRFSRAILAQNLENPLLWSAEEVWLF